MMKKIKLIIPLVALSLLLLPVDLIAKKTPDWINGSSKKYPSPQYFIGVGAVSLNKGGENQQLQWANDKARAEISKTLRTHINVETKSERRIKSRGGRESRSLDVASSQIDIVTATSSEVLEGVEIKENYRSAKDKMLYALAVLDRHKAVKRLEGKIKKAKSKMLAEMETGEKLQSEMRLLPAIAHYKKALSYAGDIAPINDLISVLRPTGSGEIDDINHEVYIEKLIHSLQRQVRFEINVEGDALGVKNYIIKGLARAGYVTKGSGSSNTKIYKLVGSTNLAYKGIIDMGKDMKMHIYQASLDLEVINPDQNETLGVLLWNANANEKTMDGAEVSAVRALGKLVEKRISDEIANLL